MKGNRIVDSQKSSGGDPHQLHLGTRIHYYRCSLPGLAGFAANRREGTNVDHHYLEFLQYFNI